MLQFDQVLCRLGSNIAHKVHCCTHFFVASGGVINTKRSITPPKELACPVEFYSTGVSDVEGFIPERTYVPSTNNKLIRLRRTSASPPLSKPGGYPAEVLYELQKAGQSFYLHMVHD